MPQDINDMMFCESCKMNAFPSKSKFNMVHFGIWTVVMFIIVLIFLASLSPFLGGILFFLYFMWGFTFLNPYLIVYALKKKGYCPRCQQKLVEKNIEYQPFGNKEPEVFKEIRP
ncbi:MAG: hypothetical protein ACFE8A_14685 [Candidatus Hodarchaeota archaeon]